MTKQTHFYLRDRHGHPIGVVAMRKEDDGVRVAASLCATTDEWDKRVGVAKAVGRLRSTKRSAPAESGYGGMDEALARLLGYECERLYDIDWGRARATWTSQYERLTTPRPA